MNIGIIGSGDVAKALAKGFLQHGHQVMLGTREPAKLADWSKENPHGQIGTFAAAAKLPIWPCGFSLLQSASFAASRVPSMT